MGQLQTRSKNQTDVKGFLKSEGFQGEIAKLVGSLDVAKRMARVCLTQVMKDEKLLACTPESLFGCLYELAALRLEPGRDAWLIPRGGKVTKIIKAEGYMRAALNSGLIANVWSDVIREADVHGMVGGSQQPRLEHSYKVGKRGSIIGAYAVAEWVDGRQTIELVDREYLDTCRSKSDKPANWDLWPEAYSRKSVTRRMCKKLPLGEDYVGDVDSKDDDLDPEVRVVNNEPTSAKAEAQPAAALAPAKTEPQAEASSDVSTPDPADTAPDPRVVAVSQGGETEDPGATAPPAEEEADVDPAKTGKPPPENPCDHCGRNVRNKKRRTHKTCDEKAAARKGMSDGADLRPANPKSVGPRPDVDGQKLNAKLAELAVENDLTVADLGATARYIQRGHKGGVLDATNTTKQKVIDKLNAPGGLVEIENLLLAEE